MLEVGNKESGYRSFDTFAKVNQPAVASLSRSRGGIWLTAALFENSSGTKLFGGSAAADQVLMMSLRRKFGCRILVEDASPR